MDCLKEVAERLSRSRNAVALTGAGISVESGIPDFRSPGGLWSRYDPLEYGHIASFRRDPGKVWRMILEMYQLVDAARPNPAHHGLAQLEKRGILKAVVTQNVDSLHQMAGSGRVIEFHGHGRTLRCETCGARYPRERVSFDVMPPECGCGGVLRPDFVFFGEEIPPKAHHEAVAVTERSDVFLVIGTSAAVAPASYLPMLAKSSGAYLVEINPEPTDLTRRLTDCHIAERAGVALPAVLEAMGMYAESRTL